ncbi:hypothetical protein [Vibrio sp. LaRot3]|uniref:hypothetical protein n=1 Tax=Vibrio sp. LaRot3 TaxID=2998829 RepID=UPI0022CE125A|nr:hypothetical protein [Vibrio sp. LaRot3]MDA0147013.1 hypothetical protein [Vibrio sp. LaRot3]
MFVIISLFISFSVLGWVYFLSTQRTTSIERKFETLITLREVLLLCRQHRAMTHHAITQASIIACEAKISAQQLKLTQLSNQLISLASFDNKAMYRVLQLKLNGLETEWSKRSIARNQRIHGTAIRHCMFLIDDLALEWLLESGRHDLSDEYHMNWQQVLDSMEVLTQLRICIQESHQPNGHLRIKYYCDKVLHKLDHLSLISALPIRSPQGLEVQGLLKQVIQDETLPINNHQLYQLTSNVSSLIAAVYDDMLNDLSKSLYQPLPELLTSQ